MKVLICEQPWNRRKSTERNPFKNMDYRSLARCRPFADLETPLTPLMLLMWVTFPVLQETLQLASTWGLFSQGFCLLWVKKNKKKDTPFLGVGSFTGSNTEALLCFTNFVPPKALFERPRVLYSVASKEKPVETFSVVPEMFPKAESYSVAFALKDVEIGVWRAASPSIALNPLPEVAASRKRKRYAKRRVATNCAKYSVLLTGLPLIDLASKNLRSMSNEDTVIIFRTDQFLNTVDELERSGFVYKTLFANVWNMRTGECDLYYVASQRTAKITAMKQAHCSQIVTKRDDTPSIELVLNLARDVFFDLDIWIV